MTAKKFDEYHSIDVKKAVEKSAEAFRGFNKAAGQFGYDLERMQRAVESPSYIMPSGLTREERRDWARGKRKDSQKYELTESAYNRVRLIREMLR